MAPVRVTAYIDYVCPYAHRGQLWFDEVNRVRPGSVEVDYRHFSLEQINNTVEGWQLWEQEEGYAPNNPARARGRALLAFWAAEAAKNQGEEAYTRFRRELFAARHDRQLDFTDREALRRVAQAAELDMERFDRDFKDRSLLQRLKENHERATGLYGVFGVPTFIFPDGASAFVKIQQVPTGQRAVDLFDRMVAAVVEHPELLEIKRPTRPQ